MSNTHTHTHTHTYNMGGRPSRPAPRPAPRRVTTWCLMPTGKLYRSGAEVGTSYGNNSTSNSYWHDSHKKYYKRWRMPPVRPRYKGSMTATECKNLRLRPSESPAHWLRIFNEDLYHWAGNANGTGTANCYRYHGHGFARNLDNCKRHR